jgi:hypothetical protein
MRMFQGRGWTAWLCVAVGVLCGCVETADVARARNRAQEVRAALDADLALGEQILHDLDNRGAPPDDPARLDAAARLDRARDSREALDRALLALDQAARDASGADDPATQDLGVFTRAIPGPAQAPVILGGALLVALLRARQLKSALVSVAESIEKAKQSDESFRQKFKEHAATIRSIQTPAARSIIRDATADGFTLSLPV